MSYIDVNGKKGYRLLVGASGKTYGNAKLLTPAERTTMLADGIVEYTPPAPPAPTPANLERIRKREIRTITKDRVGYHLLGNPEEGDDQLVMTLLELTLSITDTVKDLVAAGVVTPAQLNNRIKALNNKATEVKTARQLAVNAIQSGDTVAQFQADLDAVIAPPPAQPAP